jgi:hypothetical protein
MELYSGGFNKLSVTASFDMEEAVKKFNIHVIVYSRGYAFFAHDLNI